MQRLRHIPAADWEALFQVVAAMDEGDWEVCSGGSPLSASGTVGIPYAVYSSRVETILEFFRTHLMVPFPWSEWLRENPDISESATISNADPANVVRLITAVIRSERFNEGTIATAISSGALRAIIERLRTWHLTGT